MTQATEQIAKQYAAAAINKQQWGSVAYNALVEGLKGDGITDDTAALQALINKAIAAGRKAIFFPHATYRVTSLTNDNQVIFFGDNASFTGGYAGTINQLGDWSKISLVYSVKDYGAVGNGSDETVKIQSAIDAAVAAGFKSLYFPPGTYTATSLNNLDQVILLGDNATLTVGTAKPRIEQMGLITPISQDAALYNKAIQDMFVPKGSLSRVKKAIAENGTLKVAYWGDSITEGADYTDINDIYANRVTNAITQELPNVTVTTQNYGLSGRTLGLAVDTNYKALASEPADPTQGFFRSWSTVGKSWRDHIKDFVPDLLVVAFGMNDVSGSFSDFTEATNLQTLIDYANTWNVVPSIVIIPVFPPTKNATRTTQNQKATISVARASRAVAKANKLAIVDANRLFQILRDGIDDVATASSAESGFSTYPSKWTGDTTSFSVSGSSLVPVGAATNKYVYRNRQFYNGTIEFQVTPNGAGVSWIFYRRDPVLGQMTVLIRPGAGTGIIELYTSDSGSPIANPGSLNIPSGSASTIKIVALNNTHTIFLNGSQVLSVTVNRKLINGMVGFGGDAALPTISNLTITYQDPIQGYPLYTEDELLGKYNDASSGNGINHPSGMGHYLFMYAAFKNVIREIAVKEETGLFTPRRILAPSWAAPGGGYPATTNAGEKIWYVAIAGKYDKTRGVALRRVDNYNYYGLSSVAVSQATLAQLENGKFAHFYDGSGNDLVFVSVPAAGSVTWDTELYRYTSQP